MRLRITALAVLAVVITAFAVFAQTVNGVPSSMNFQGRVSKPDGTPIPDGTIPEVIFRIYASANANTPVWSQTFGNIAVKNGVLSVLLGGNQNPITPIILNGTPYLGITLNNNPELTPRQPFASNAFAFKAATIPDGSLTASKFAPGLGAVPTGYQILSPVNVAPPGYSATGFTITANSGGIGPGTFATRATAPVQASGTAAAAYNGLVYLFAGETNHVFDPSANTWTRKNFPTTLNGGGAVTVGTQIYVFTPGHTFEYDPVVDIFTPKADVPSSNYGSGYAAVGTKIYVIDSQYNREYDIVSNTWTLKASLPTQRGLLTVAAVNGKVYVIGGFNGTALTNVDEYDPATNTWAAKAPLTTGRVGATAVTAGSLIYVFGGGDTNANPVTAPVASFDPVANAWTDRANLPTNRFFLTSALVNNKVYVLCGSTAPNNQNEEYTVPSGGSTLLYLFQKN